MGVENAADRTAEMIAQAREIIGAARYRAGVIDRATKGVIASLACGLKEQGLTDKAVAEVLGVSRNRISEIVAEGMYLTAFDGVRIDDDAQRREITTEVLQLYRPIATQPTGWVQVRAPRSGRLLEANGIQLPRMYQEIPGELDTEAAEFVNRDSGERILVYSLERHHGTVLYDSDGKFIDYDFKGEYHIDLCSPTGGRQPLPLALLGIDQSDLKFGKGWTDLPRHRVEDDAFANAVGAVRRYYGIWPVASVQEKEHHL
ncbi:hypothetical protein BKG67_04925 [Mycobacteroides chelonae]|nr:hypothetical protein BKG66_07870 [Mycobacteroides chelonae]OHT75948.1 hypothetical protein BKG67_04925 [Mycobacteroides chelonae]